MSDKIKISLFKRDGSDVYQMQYRDPVTGKKCRKTTGTNRKREAERIAGNWEKQIRSGKQWSQGKMNWHVFRDRFEAQRLAGLADSAAKKSTTVLNVLDDIKPTESATDRIANVTVLLRTVHSASTT